MSDTNGNDVPAWSAGFSIRRTVYAIWLLLAVPELAHAWGSATHVAEGTYILNHLGLLLPVVAEVIGRFPRDFLYGCLGADIFVGRGSRRTKRHCHNWEVGFDVLDRASTDQQEAFAYGYLSHLASDVVAHNFYVPNLFAEGRTRGRLTHSYWEFRAEVLHDAQFFSLARSVAVGDHEQHDELMRKTTRRAVIPFRAKKGLFVSSLILCEREKMNGCPTVRRTLHRYPLDPQFVYHMQSLALGLAVDVLRRPQHSPCLAYDPIGATNLVISTQLAKRLSGGSGLLFAVPPELLEIALPYPHLTTAQFEGTVGRASRAKS